MRALRKTPEAAPAELPGQMCHSGRRLVLLVLSVGFGNVGHRLAPSCRAHSSLGSTQLSKTLPHSDLTEAATASGPFFHLDNGFALLPFLPQLRQNTQGSERSLPQGCSSIRKISRANRLINLIRHISLEELD